MNKKKLGRPTSRERRRRISRLSPYPPLLEEELQLAWDACRDLLREYAERPARFGLPRVGKSARFESQLLPPERCRELPDAFLAEWEVLEARYWRAVELLRRSRTEPGSLMSGSMFYHVVQEYMREVVYIHHAEVTSKSLSAREEKRQGEYVPQAQAIAAELWKEDPDMKLGPMGEMVLKKLQEMGAGHFLPGTPRAVAEAIRPVAPESAKKKGRPRKK